MDIQRIHIRNFLTIADATVRLDNRGVNLIQGVNADDTSASSNGAGKSTIADALCWALFGTTARGESSDGVVNETAKKDCEVKVTWIDGDITYNVFRYRKHSMHKNEVHLVLEDKNGTSTALTKGTNAETDAEIVRVLGCTLEVFVASIYAGQEQMPDIPAMTDKPLKLLIEQASGSERLERAYEIARSKAATAEFALSNAKGTLDAANLRLGEIRRDIERAKIRSDDYEDKREPAAQDYERVAREIEAEIQALQAKLTVDPAAVNAGIAKIQEQLAQTTPARKAADDYARLVYQPAIDVGALNLRMMERTTEEAKALRSEYDGVQSKIGTPCGDCGKPYTEDDLASVRELIKQKLNAKVAEVTRLRNEQVRLEAEANTLRAERDRLQALVPDVTALNAKLFQLNQAATTLQEAAAGIQRKQTLVKIAQDNAAAIRASANPHKEALEEAVAKARAAIETVKQQTTIVQAAEKERDLANDVMRVFGPAGVRAHILDTVTPFLNARTAEYLSALTDGNCTAIWSTLSRNAKGEVKEKFAIDVDHAKGGKKYKLLSGGEKGKVRLACMLALQDLVASRATKPINLWIGDEIDGALDPAGLERLMVILEKKARERGTVLVISHNELRDWIDNVTVVTKQGGFSRVEGALTTS